MKNIVAADTLIGKTVLSRASGNKLGEIEDLFIDPLKGVLMGLTIKDAEGHLGGLDYNDVYSFGEDAVMANGDEKIVPLEENWLAKHPHAKKHLTGINIVSETGNFLGKVANIYLRLTRPPIVIYEVGETILDRWLGRDFFIPASAGTAISEDAERIVIPIETANSAAPTLEALFTGETAPDYTDKRTGDVVIGDRVNERETNITDRIEEEPLRRKHTRA